MSAWRKKLLLQCLLAAVLWALTIPFLPHQRLEYPWQDLRYRWNVGQEQISDTQVVVVGIDARTLSEITAPFSLWSDVHATIVGNLRSANALVVTPDLLWELDPQSVQTLGPGLELLAEILTQAELEMALLARENVVIGAHLDSGKLNLPTESLQAMAGPNLALLNLDEDGDGAIRQYLLTVPVQQGGQVLDWPSLGLASSKLAGGPEAEDVPQSESGSFWLNYRGPAGSFPYFSAVDIYRGQVPDLTGKVVLYGPHDRRLGDAHRSPFSTGEPDMYGVEIHANAIHTLLNRDFLKPAPPDWQVFAVLVLAVLTATFFVFMSPLPALLISFLLGCTWATFSAWSFTHSGRVWDVSAVLLVIFLTAASCYVLRYFTVERSRKNAEKLFGKYAPAQVVEQILRDPSLARLGASQTVETTIWFCDINNFSTVSEKVRPAELIEMVNAFFEEMAHIIHKHGGVIRQYVGDEIMVIFGAPSPLENHARAALEMTVEAFQRLWELERKAQGKVGFYEIKVGIHSGTVVCGNVGSSERMEYTAVGDDVNLASRVMGLNKQFGTLALVSQETVKLAGGLPKGLELNPLGDHPVKGRENPVEIYEIGIET
ncbi:MAG: adenylate/guanylate cyclase domain-containing protein, partial [Vulcanimicrobiota bacterium]